MQVSGRLFIIELIAAKIISIQTTHRLIPNAIRSGIVVRPVSIVYNVAFYVKGEAIGVVLDRAIVGYVSIYREAARIIVVSDSPCRCNKNVVTGRVAVAVYHSIDNNIISGPWNYPSDPCCIVSPVATCRSRMDLGIG